MDGLDYPGSGSCQGMKEPLSRIKDRGTAIQAVEFQGKLP
jgi:hypothetical protein